MTTVALALAILAFAVQILFYVAQTAAASDQAKQMMLLNTETRSLLENVKTNVGGMQDLLKSHFEYVLKKAFEGRAPSEEADASGDDPEPQAVQPEPVFMEPSSVASEAVSALVLPENPEEASLLRPRLVYSPRVGPFAPDADDLRVLKTLAEFPAEPEGRELHETIRKLTPISIAVLSNYARNEREARMRGVRGYFVNSEGSYRSRQLRELALLEAVPEHPLVRRPRADKVRLGLSEVGLQVARLLIGKGHVPEWLVRLESSG